MASKPKKTKPNGNGSGYPNEKHAIVTSYNTYDFKDAIRKTLICPQCNELPEKVIWQCSGGHIVCYNCASEGLYQLCRICGNGLTNVRSKVLEFQLQLLKEWNIGNTLPINPSVVPCQSINSAVVPYDPLIAANGNSKMILNGLRAPKCSMNSMDIIEGFGKGKFVQHLVQDHDAKMLHLELGLSTNINIFVNEITPDSIQPRVLTCGPELFILNHSVFIPESGESSDSELMEGNSIVFWISTLLPEPDALKYTFYLKMAAERSVFGNSYTEWRVKPHCFDTPVATFVNLQDACAVPMFILRPISNRISTAGQFEGSWWNYAWILECRIEKCD